MRISKKKPTKFSIYLNLGRVKLVVNNRKEYICKYCCKPFSSDIEDDDECNSCWSKKNKGENLKINCPDKKPKYNTNLLENLQKNNYPKIGSQNVFLRRRNRSASGTGYYHYYLGFYHPTDRGQDLFSRKIYPDFKEDFKRYYEPAAKEFAEYLVNDIVRKNLEYDLIIPIPSSTAGRISGGHKIITSLVSEKTGIEDGMGILKRTKSIPKSATSGLKRPDIHKHLSTIECDGDVNGKKVLLFDDIYTTGNTAGACVIKLVHGNNASEVDVVTLGRTEGRYL